LTLRAYHVNRIGEGNNAHPMAKKTAAQNSKTSSAPLKRRASNRAKSNNGAIPESRTPRVDDRTEAGPVIEITPSVPPIIDRIKRNAAVRARSAPIVGGELADGVIVDFLPNFEIDGRQDIGADRIPCGELTGLSNRREEVQVRFVPKVGEGYFRFRLRRNGQPVKNGQFVEFIPALNPAETDIDLDELDDDILEESSSDDIEVVRLRERLRYEQKLREAHGHNGNGHNPIVDKLLERVLAEKLNPVDPIEHVVATLEAVEKIKESVRPHRESPPAPAPQPQVDPKVSALKIIAENPSLTEIAKEVFGFGSKGDGDGDRWAEVAMKAVEKGEASKIANALVNLVSTGLGSLASAFAPKPAQPPAQQAPQSTQQTAPTVQNTQAAPQVAPANVEHPAQLPASDQQPQAQAERQQQIELTPAEQALAVLMNDCAQNIPVQITFDKLMNYADAINDQYPLHSIDGYLKIFAAMPVDTALAFVAKRPGCASVTALPHAKEWCDSLQQLLKQVRWDDAESDDEFDSFVEIDSRKGEVKL
jgi:hypothetical protein